MPGSLRDMASSRPGAFSCSKSAGPSVWTLAGTLSRSIKPGSRAAGAASRDAGAEKARRAGVLVVVAAGADVAGAGRAAGRGLAGASGVLEMTRTSGRLTSSARIAPGSTTFSEHDTVRPHPRPDYLFLPRRRLYHFFQILWELLAMWPGRDTFEL